MGRTAPATLQLHIGQHTSVDIAAMPPIVAVCSSDRPVSVRPTGAVAGISFDPRSGVRAPGRAGAALGGWSCRTVDTRPAAADSQESDRRPRNTQQPRTHR